MTLRSLATYAVIATACLATAAPAGALTDGEAVFLDRMAAEGISSDHGFVDSNSRESREVLQTGWGLCSKVSNGMSWLDAERTMITAEATDHSMGNGRDLDRRQVSLIVNSARELLCP